MDTLSSQPSTEENSGNPIGLEVETASAVATDLRRHQASLSVLFHQYQKHHWMVEGHVFRDLHHDGRRRLQRPDRTRRILE